MTFELQYTDAYSDARAGRIQTAHGEILTPIFMPVGTVGSVKGVHFRELQEQVKAQIILGNTYAYNSCRSLRKWFSYLSFSMKLATAS